MKKILLLLTLISFSAISQNNPARWKDGVETKFVALDTLTIVQRDALTLKPSKGYVIFNADTNVLNLYNGTSWGEIGATPDLSAYQLKPIEGAFVDGDKTKLDGIEVGATANDTDANLLNRANHTGTQTASTISDFDTEVSNNTDVTANTAKVSFPEAPIDGTQYARKDAGWEAVPLSLPAANITVSPSIVGETDAYAVMLANRTSIDSIQANMSGGINTTPRHVTSTTGVFTEAFNESQPNVRLNVTENTNISITSMDTKDAVIFSAEELSGTERLVQFIGTSDTLRANLKNELAYFVALKDTVQGITWQRSYKDGKTNKVRSITSSGTSTFIKWNESPYWKLNLISDENIIFQDPESSMPLTLEVRQDATGSRLIVFVNDLYAPSGTLPTLTTTANGIDVIRFFYDKEADIYRLDESYLDYELVAGIDLEAPSAPSSLVASNATTTTIDLDWTASTDNVDVVGYRIYDSGVLLEEIGDVITYTLTGLTDDTEYNLTVRAFDAADNESADSNLETISTTSAATAFVMTVETTGASELFTVPTFSTATNDIDVDWGDGSASEPFVGSSLTISHTYATAGTYTVSIAGDFSGIYNSAFNEKIQNISQWGTSVFDHFRFQNLRTDITATDIPNLTNVTDLGSAFRDNFNNIANLSTIGSWYMANKTSTGSMFRAAQLPASKITGISSWVGFAPTSISNMFQSSTTSLNHDLSNWSIANLTSATDFNVGGTTWSTTNYSNTLIDWGGQAPSIQTGVTFNAGSATIYTQTSVDSGTTTSTTASKLVDSTQNFLTTVTVGDIIRNTTDNTYAKVTAIDSDTQLSIQNDIMVSGETYVVQSSAAAKARYVLDNDYSWTIIDGGGI